MQHEIASVPGRDPVDSVANVLAWYSITYTVGRLTAAERIKNPIREDSLVSTFVPIFPP